jgi:hypothetical protein
MNLPEDSHARNLFDELASARKVIASCAELLPFINQRPEHPPTQQSVAMRLTNASNWLLTHPAIEPVNIDSQILLVRTDELSKEIPTLPHDGNRPGPTC